MSERAASRFATGRHGGIMVPLFSIPSRESWGIGEIPDLVILSRWLESAGLTFLQLLPVNEMAEGQHSPYSAMTAMAIDPIFIALRDVADFAEAGGLAALEREDAAALRDIRTSPAVDYGGVRRLKQRALARSFESFYTRHWTPDSPRAGALRAFAAREQWWLGEYALFRALHEAHESRAWTDWAPPLRDRDPAALEDARRRLERRILYFQYLQWLAHEQWQRTRELCAPVGIFGDFPFMVSADSADVWARQHEFRLDLSVGVPPDAFSTDGQDWGLPAYRWDVVEAGGYEWLQQRTRRSAELFDGFRIDHLVGFYRTFVKDAEGRTSFMPEGEDAQRAQGERLMRLFASGGATILAEDLGTVPDFVRESMAALGVPGMKVLRWEREWDAPGRPFRDPAGYPPVSVATSGTHDTETMAEWWNNADDEERRALLCLPLLRARGLGPDVAYTPALRDALLETLVASRSNLLILPMQDVFGWCDRINVPASVDERNWTWRLPFPVEELLSARDPAERAEFLRTLTSAAGRS